MRSVGAHKATQELQAACPRSDVGFGRLVWQCLNGNLLAQMLGGGDSTEGHAKQEAQLCEWHQALMRLIDSEELDVPPVCSKGVRETGRRCIQQPWRLY